MKLQSITIEKKKFLIVPEKEYLSLKEDVVDLKKVFARRKEKGIEATDFFNKLERR